MSSSGRNDDSQSPFFTRLLDAFTKPIQSFMDEAFSGRGSSDRGAVGWLTAPFRFLGGLAVFLVQAWASSRVGLAFALGFPAILSIAVFLAAAWFANFKQNRLYGSAKLGFDLAAQRSVEEPKERAIALDQRARFAQRMVKLRPDSKEDKYELGAAMGTAGDIPAALDIMRLLAPDDQAGMSDAHLWRAGYYQNEKWYQASDEQRDQIVLQQLDMAIQQQKDNKQAHKSMSVIHIRKAATFDNDSPEQNKHLEEALSHLNAMLDGGIQSIDHLLASMQIVEIQRQLYGVETARKSFDQMYTNILEPASKRHPNIFQIWLVLVKCAVALEDFPLAKKFVRDGFVTSDSNEVRKQIADLSSLVLLREADIADDMSDRDEYKARLYALTRAISVNPRNEDIYQRLVKFVDSGSGDHFNMAWFEEAKVASPDPGVLTTMLGLRAMMDGDIETAKTHWRVSQQLFTLSELVLNHLIVVGARTNQQDFSNPVDLLSKSLSAFPDNPILLQSRGYFLIKEGKDDLAIKDLEAAVETLPNLVEARQFLILLYQKLGDTNQAADHQQRQFDTLGKFPEKRRKDLTEQLEKVTL